MQEKFYSPGANVTGWYHWDTLKAGLQSVLVGSVPLGYEDETGFHFGVKARFGNFALNHLSEAPEAPAAW